ncbi:MAG: lactococcin family bacteriocin [Oscillospiraceae bacterium]|nr:lactococcin family bacteriocin [Oscillospiraceae bacterium]
MMDNKEFNALTDEELAVLSGGYVKINSAGCYDLYDDEGNYQWTFRGDQLQQLREYAGSIGISDEIIRD